MRIIQIILVTFLVAGCTTNLTSGSQEVQVINASMAQDCEFVSGLDEISNGGRSRSEEINNAMLASKHKAAELGADSIEILDTDFILFTGGVVKANAYKCR